MAFELGGAAKLHRAIFEQYVSSQGSKVTLRFPETRTSGSGDDVDKVFGPSSRETTPGTTADVTAIVTTPKTSMSTPGLPQGGKLGKLAASDIILKLKLHDVLLKEGEAWGRTQFDTCRDVVIDNRVFHVTVTDRKGLPSEGPYALLVGLSGISEEAS